MRLGRLGRLGRLEGGRRSNEGNVDFGSPIEEKVSDLKAAM